MSQDSAVVDDIITETKDEFIMQLHLILFIQILQHSYTSLIWLVMSLLVQEIKHVTCI